MLKLCQFHIIGHLRTCNNSASYLVQNIWQYCIFNYRASWWRDGNSRAVESLTFKQLQGEKKPIRSIQNTTLRGLVFLACWYLVSWGHRMDTQHWPVQGTWAAHGEKGKWMWSCLAPTSPWGRQWKNLICWWRVLCIHIFHLLQFH